MASDLLRNEAITFICARDFMYDGVDYQMCDDFPQEAANDIETLVRARFIIPVVDDLKDRPAMWYTEVKQRDDALHMLRRDLVQVVMPDAEVPIPTGGEVSPYSTEPEEQSEQSEQFDPADYTVAEVLEYLAQHPEETERVRAAERAGRGRKGILEES